MGRRCQAYRGDVHRYARWLIVEAPDKESALGFAYGALLSDPSYRPMELPLVFVRARGATVTLRYPKAGLSFVVHGPGATATTTDWVSRITTSPSDPAAHGGRLVPRGEQLEFHVRGAAGDLIVLSEAYHPRRRVRLGDEFVQTFPVEPGLISFRLPLSGVFLGAVDARFLPREIACMGLSALAWLVAILMLFGWPRCGT